MDVQATEPDIKAVNHAVDYAVEFPLAFRIYSTISVLLIDSAYANGVLSFASLILEL